MATDLQPILEKHGKLMAVEVAHDVEAGITGNIMDETEFSSPDPAIGEPVSATMQLRPRTIEIKQAENARFPGKPRYRTGAMYESIEVAVTDRGANVVIGEQEKATGQQDGTFTPDNRLVPPRPFWGVTAEAVQESQRTVDQMSPAMVQEMNNVTLPPIVLAL